MWSFKQNESDMKLNFVLNRSALNAKDFIILGSKHFSLRHGVLVCSGSFQSSSYAFGCRKLYKHCHRQTPKQTSEHMD